MKLFLYSLGSIGLFSLLGISLIFFHISPEEFPKMAPALLYSLIFLFSLSLFSLLGFFIRKIFYPRLNKFIAFHLSLRQALLLSFFLCVSLAFLQFSIVEWWTEILLFFVLIFIEFIFIVRSSKK